MSIYQNVKANITTRQAAELYGLQIARNGMTRCPFHDDHTPSMKVDERFHCFGCQADGDVIDFTARLFEIGSYAAAQKLAADFAIKDNRPSVLAQLREPQPRYSHQQKQRQAETFCNSVLTDYSRLLTRWKTQYAPACAGSPIDDRYVEACQMIPCIEYLLDCLCASDLELRTFTVNSLTTDDKLNVLKDRTDRLSREEQSHDRNDISL